MRSPLLEFDSPAFPVLPEEADEINPHIHGKALAQWLGNELRSLGVPVGEPFKEDFGWYMDLKSGPHILAVICSGEEAEHWMVYASVSAGLLARLSGKDSSAQVLADLFGKVRRILETEPSVRNLRESG
jgi:hypothetical protein